MRRSSRHARPVSHTRSATVSASSAATPAAAAASGRPDASSTAASTAPATTTICGTARTTAISARAASGIPAGGGEARRPRAGRPSCRTRRQSSSGITLDQVCVKLARAPGRRGRLDRRNGESCSAAPSARSGQRPRVVGKAEDETVDEVAHEAANGGHGTEAGFRWTGILLIAVPIRASGRKAASANQNCWSWTTGRSRVPASFPATARPVMSHVEPVWRSRKRPSRSGTKASVQPLTRRSKAPAARRRASG